MTSRRTPNRVHVVRPPENDSHAPSASQNIEIIRTLAKIGDKLKRSEAERYELLAELRDYRRSLRDLEDKSENAEQAYLAVENKLNSTSMLDADVSQRQIRFERSLKETEDKMLKSMAGQAIIDKRLSDTEDKQLVIDQRLDQSLSEQVKLKRQMDIISQDKALMMRKVERLEEILLETQDSLRGREKLLLADASKKPSHLSAPAWDNVKAAPPKMKKPRPVAAKENRWPPYINVQSVSAAGLIFAALLMGWSINQMQKTQEKSLAAAVTSPVLSSPSQTAGDVQKVVMTPDALPKNVLDYNDDQLLAALDNNPEKLAAQLNDIEVSAVTPQTDTQIQPAIADPKITPEMENFEAVAFVQDLKTSRAVMAERSASPLSQRIQADDSLPADVKRLEEKAFQGDAKSQDYLGAIYLAGYEGVSQNFNKAGIWYREAAHNGVADAQYNLAVLYQQGLDQDRDVSRAVYWYREAAKQEHAQAQHNLGVAHIDAIGAEYNPQLAAAFFERAANKGIADAAYSLGFLHERGDLGSVKYDEALLWYKIAADQGSVQAQKAIGKLSKTLQIGMGDIDNLVDRMQIINESVKGRRAGPSKVMLQESRNKASLIENDAELIRQIQEYLMLTGAYAGPADGVNGKETRESIRSYQAANSLPVDGRISEALLNSMVGGAIDRLNSRN